MSRKYIDTELQDAMSHAEEMITDSSGDVFLDLGLVKEASLIALVQKRDEQIAELRKEVDTLEREINDLNLRIRDGVTHDCSYKDCVECPCYLEGMADGKMVAARNEPLT